ncbi:MAG: GHMP kinase [Acidobacteria bacterium]|nr:GHMP kinase [Acidobacteriota bacterium]
MIINAKSPCRVDLAGGTMDIWPLYLFHDHAVTVNFAVNRYTSCELRTRDDGKIILRSRDQQAEETFESYAALRAARSYRLKLLSYVVRYWAPECGVELTTHSEAPAGAGISGSSSLFITTCAAFNRLTGARHPIEKIREIAQNIEAQTIRVPTGSQDYFPAMYGGVSAIELDPLGSTRKAIPVDLGELNRRIVLAYTGEPRDSGINNWEVTKAHIDGNRQVFRNFERIAEIAHAMRGALERADWAAAGGLLREEWAHRKKNAPGISTPLIDRLIAAARRQGALGGKVCGAGGGGCVIFLVEPEAKQRVSQVVVREGAELLDVCVAPRGVQILVKK